MSELGSSKSINWSGLRELIEPPSVPASPRPFCASLDIGTPVRLELGLNSVSLLVLKDSVDITLRKVLPSVNSLGLSASTTLFFLDIDLNLVEDGSVGTSHVVTCLGECSWEWGVGARGAGGEAFFDFAGQIVRGMKEGSGLVLERSQDKDAGGETGHGAICWLQSSASMSFSQFRDCE
jgi:hypothetical protein